jgi:hypothetical protein
MLPVRTSTGALMPIEGQSRCRASLMRTPGAKLREPIQIECALAIHDRADLSGDGFFLDRCIFTEHNQANFGSHRVEHFGDIFKIEVGEVRTEQNIVQWLIGVSQRFASSRAELKLHFAIGRLIFIGTGVGDQDSQGTCLRELSGHRSVVTFKCESNEFKQAGCVVA